MQVILLYILFIIVPPIVFKMWFLAWIGLAGLIMLGISELIVMKVKGKTISKIVQETNQEKYWLSAGIVLFAIYMATHLILRW
jgi:hypothetical protein